MKIAFVRLLLVAGLLAVRPLRASQTTIPEDNPGRAKAIAWVEANAKVDPHAALVADLTKVIDAALMKDGIVQVILGPARLKSGRPTGLWLIDEEFFSFEFTDQQAQRMDLQPDAAKVNLFPQIEELNGVQLFEISELHLDGAEHFDGARPLSGTVSSKALAPGAVRDFTSPVFPGGDAAERFELRLWYIALGGDAPTISYYHPSGRVPARGDMHFSCLPFNTDDRLKKMDALDRTAATGLLVPVAPREPAKRISGPVVIFATLCVKARRPSKGSDRGFSIADVVCSNVTAQLVNVEEPPAAAAP